MSRLYDPIKHFIETSSLDQKEKLLKYHDDYLPLMLSAKGSSHNHQAWEGGYYDHIEECLSIGNFLYWRSYRDFPFSEGEVILTLYFHDIEKMWKYTHTLNPNWVKAAYLEAELPATYGIKLPTSVLEAIKYIHGEGEDYTPLKRVMSELAGFCHAVDVLSARVWHYLPLPDDRILNVRKSVEK